jgi:hypothetical protein
VKRAAASLIAVVLTGAGAGAIGASFSSATDSSGNSFSAAATFPQPLAFVKTVGTATCGGTSDVVTVPAGGVAAGNTLVVRVGLRDGTVSSFMPTVSDSKGNSYQLDVDQVSTSVRVAVFSAHVATALAAADTVTVSHPSIDSTAIAVEEYAGVVDTGRVDQTASGAGSSANPTATVATTNADALIVGSVVQNQPEGATQPGAWTGLSSVLADCGGAPREMSLHRAYRIESATGSYTYDPTLSVSRQWADVIAAYKP